MLQKLKWKLGMVILSGASLQCHAASNNFRTIHVFSPLNWHDGVGFNADGANPFGLILNKGTLYGTTLNGGTKGRGTVFKVRTDGSGFTTLHHFSGSDGAWPQARLTLCDDMLYGTTSCGENSSPTGTVFVVRTDGTAFTTIYTFTGSKDGGTPHGGMTLVGSTLYGAAYLGGNYASHSLGYGTLFVLNTSGTAFGALHTFSGIDGAKPICQPLVFGNCVFGTTEQGGSGRIGTIFKINVDGTGFTNLHHFMLPYGSYPNWTNTDGIYLESGLVLSGDTLFGSAVMGGSGNHGTVFAVNTDGSDFKVVHSFGGDDGSEPIGLAVSRDVLYGVAGSGGSFGKGTIFSLNTNGTDFKTCYTFSGETDGARPPALILFANALYGVAEYGGCASAQKGSGTLFMLKLND